MKFLRLLYERKFSSAERVELAKKGFAMKDGSFPIENEEDLKNAIRMASKGKNPTEARKHIVKRATVLKKLDAIPKTWNQKTGKLNENNEPQKKFNAAKFNAFLDKFPDNATSWKDATQEPLDIYNALLDAHNEKFEEEPSKQIENKNVGRSKTPAEMNQKFKKLIKEVLSKTTVEVKDYVYNYYSHWFEKQKTDESQGFEEYMNYEDGLKFIKNYKPDGYLPLQQEFDKLVGKDWKVSPEEFSDFMIDKLKFDKNVLKAWFENRNTLNESQNFGTLFIADRLWDAIKNSKDFVLDEFAKGNFSILNKNKKLIGTYYSKEQALEVNNQELKDFIKSSESLTDLEFTVTQEEVQQVANENNIDIFVFDFSQIEKGLKVELEHGKQNPETNVTNDNLVETLKIVVAHLNEDKEYYTKLEEVEGTINEDLEYMDSVTCDLSGLANEKGTIIAYTKDSYVVELDHESEFANSGKGKSNFKQLFPNIKKEIFSYEDDFEIKQNCWYTEVLKKDCKKINESFNIKPFVPKKINESATEDTLGKEIIKFLSSSEEGVDMKAIVDETGERYAAIIAKLDSLKIKGYVQNQDGYWISTDKGEKEYLGKSISESTVSDSVETLIKNCSSLDGFKGELEEMKQNGIDTQAALDELDLKYHINDKVQLSEEQFLSTLYDEVKSVASTTVNEAAKSWKPSQQSGWEYASFSVANPSEGDRVVGKEKLQSRWKTRLKKVLGEEVDTTKVSNFFSGHTTDFRFNQGGKEYRVYKTGESSKSSQYIIQRKAK